MKKTIGGIVGTVGTDGNAVNCCASDIFRIIFVY